MASQKKLIRLCRLREIEEEQSRLELERAVAVRNRLERALELAVEQEFQTKREFGESVWVYDQPGRTGATLAAGLAGMQRQNLAKRRNQWDLTVAGLREDYLQRRIGHQQIESLVSALKRKDETVAANRAQQMLDDWYRRRNQKAAIGPDRSPDKAPRREVENKS